jgi:hypothetical protein
MRYLVLTPNLGLWYPKGYHFDLISYSNANYAGCKVDRKSASETYQFLDRSLVSWSSKKQNAVTVSTTEVEYVTAGSCCVQLVRMRQTLKDYGYAINQVPLLCDNESVILIAYNPCEHSRTKTHKYPAPILRDHAIKGGGGIIISHV